MKNLIASVCFLSLAAGASAFELSAVNAAALRAAPAAQPPAAMPAAVRGLEDDMPHGAIAGAQDYARLAADFAKASAPDREDLLAWNAGRVYAKDSPDYPFGLLLAGRLTGGEFLLSVMAQGVQPAFYEQLSPSLVPGITVLLNETAKNWTLPEFTASGAKFERIQPPYAKGYSRFEARKAADGRILLRHDWKSDMAGYSDSGTDYAVLTKDVTPK